MSMTSQCPSKPRRRLPKPRRPCRSRRSRASRRSGLSHGATRLGVIGAMAREATGMATAIGVGAMAARLTRTTMPAWWQTCRKTIIAGTQAGNLWKASEAMSGFQNARQLHKEIKHFGFRVGGCFAAAGHAGSNIRLQTRAGSNTTKHRCQA